VVFVAALNLVLDFDFIERGASQGAPKYMEWYGAFGLLVTLVWLYLEILRLLGRLNRRSLVVLMTDFVDTITAELMVENLGRLAARHLVICVTLQDPALFATVEAAPTSLDDVARSVVADGFIRERTVVFERLRRLGVHSLDVPAERMGMEMLNRYLLIKRRELI